MQLYSLLAEHQMSHPAEREDADSRLSGAAGQSMFVTVLPGCEQTPVDVDKERSPAWQEQEVPTSLLGRQCGLEEKIMDLNDLISA